MGILERSSLCLASVAAIFAIGASQAAADPAVGVIDGTNLLASFDTASPGTFTSVKHVTGLDVGERLAGVDFRWHPNNETSPLPPPQLFGLGVTGQLASDKLHLYTIDLATAVATPIGAAITAPTGGGDYGIDFNPAVDRIRVVNDADENLRMNPNNGTVAGDDPNLTPAGREVSGIAYDRVEIQIPPLVPTNTTLFGISVATAHLVTIGGVNQVPSPNGGLVQNEKALGLALAPESPAELDISPAGTAYASLVASSGQPGLYAVDLGSGQATLLGPLSEALGSLAIVPEPPPPVPVATPDLTAPTVSLAGVKSSMPLKTFLRGISIDVTASEPAGLDAELLGAAKSARLASFNLILASASASIAPGRRTLKLKPSRRLIGTPAKAFRVSLRVTATDASKNASTATKTITVRLDKKKRRSRSARGSRAAALRGHR